MRVVKVLFCRVKVGNDRSEVANEDDRRFGGCSRHVWQR
jgi:hypothetical protein